MIPRTRVNYGLSDLARALFSNERSEETRRSLLAVLCSLFNHNQILLTSSGRGGLFILLSCLPHRRVVVPAYTCKAVLEAVSLTGKQVVFVETDDGGFNPSSRAFLDKLDSDTIVIATHQFGFPCEVEIITQEARKAGAFVIEDAAASLGSKVNGKLTGTFGDAAFFSFDSTKLVNVPLKGGFILMKDADLSKRCAAFMSINCRQMPIMRKIYYLILGTALVLIGNPWIYRLFHNIKFKWRNQFTDESQNQQPSLGPFYIDRLAEWQAIVLLPQVERLDDLISTRQRLYSEYMLNLGGLKLVRLPPEDSRSEWAPIRFPIRVQGDKLSFYRESVRRGVDYAFSFTFIGSPSIYKLSHQLAAAVLDLPFYERLSREELMQVVSVVKEVDDLLSQNAKTAG